jgi:hypothetical protein
MTHVPDKKKRRPTSSQKNWSEKRKTESGIHCNLTHTWRHRPRGPEGVRGRRRGTPRARRQRRHRPIGHVCRASGRSTRLGRQTPAGLARTGRSPVDSEEINDIPFLTLRPGRQHVHKEESITTACFVLIQFGLLCNVASLGSCDI